MKRAMIVMTGALHELAGNANETLLAKLAPIRDEVMSNITEGDITVPQATQRQKQYDGLSELSC
ncbi:hypothetical protein [Candidatus Colwellia aromaticivorans]|uniref:hypothetical protein n=1 Tax=Candidatus Colwellia aromaticivorans TaxID=2267621 RepID=UPI00109BD2FD|nr:hypothetical protein [Candidatus Colwellia aromaticivorans]